MEGDYIRLEQILRNLLGNAVKYTPDGGQIRVLAGQEESGQEAAATRVVIKIRDSGIGISKELLPRIFDIFTQADQSLDRSEGGLALA